MSNFNRTVGTIGQEDGKLLGTLRKAGIVEAVDRAGFKVERKSPILLTFQQVDAQASKQQRYKSTLYYPDVVIVAEATIEEIDGFPEFGDTMAEFQPAPRVSKVVLCQNGFGRIKLTVSAMDGNIYFETAEDDRLDGCTHLELTAHFRRWLCHPTM